MPFPSYGSYRLGCAARAVHADSPHPTSMGAAVFRARRLSPSGQPESCRLRISNARLECSCHSQSQDRKHSPAQVQLPENCHGACFCALSVMACPVAEMSFPAPAVVWQPPSTGAMPINASRAKAMARFLRMVTAFRVCLTIYRAPNPNAVGPRDACNQTCGLYAEAIRRFH